MNMKRILTMLLGVGIMLGLGACSNNGGAPESKDVDLDALRTEIVDTYYAEGGMFGEFNEELYTNVYGVAAADVEAAAGIVSATSMTNVDIAMFKAVDGKAESIKTALETYLENQKNGFGYPSVIDGYNNAKIYTNGNYVFLVMAVDSYDEDGNLPSPTAAEQIVSTIEAKFN